MVGFDGQDPRITEKLMAEGKLPHFSKLKDQGSYARLRSTYPSITPVAWSSFCTGANPGKHNIWSTVIRVPITFPPDRFYGAQLGAMCIPDLLGTQGTFLLFSTRKENEEFQEGGMRFELRSNGSKDSYLSSVHGPENSFFEGNPPMELSLKIELDRSARRAHVTIDQETLELTPNELSSYVKLEFKALPGIKVSGICRVMLTEMDEHVSLYFTPIHISPSKPAMPISHPGYYSAYLEKKVGPYSTLGLAEDTWALNEKIIDDQTFMQQTQDIDNEREKMFFTAVKKLKKGALITVFDAADRVNHMFWRYTEENHPSACGIENPEHANAIVEQYIRNDAILGRVMDEVNDDDFLMVLSDHGCTSFRRGVNLNAWLLKEGYLFLKEGADPSEPWLQSVDWSRTRAYAVGLVGIFLNIKGREVKGIVSRGDNARKLKQELIAKLNGLQDSDKSETAINEAWDTDTLYNGPYKGNAPDLLVGYNHGYRISWDCASGVVAGAIFEDNTKAWSGDHIVDPRLVPGVLFCNQPITTDDPAIIDLAPTALSLFGLTPPPHMEGTSIVDLKRFGA